MTTTDQAVRLYSVAALAQLWGTSREYIYEEIRERRLPAISMGNGDRRKLRVSAVDAAKWIAEHRSVGVRGIAS